MEIWAGEERLAESEHGEDKDSGVWLGSGSAEDVSERTPVPSVLQQLVEMQTVVVASCCQCKRNAVVSNTHFTQTLSLSAANT